VSPYVSSDGYTIDLLTNFQLIQFLGYDDPAATGQLPHIPLPHFNRQDIKTSVKLRDGQTLVLGGLTAQRSMIAKDKVPVLGDIPLVGRLFRHEKEFFEPRHVLVFITPTIIDPAGNAVHSPGQLPPAKDAVPPQPAEK
jgi:type II secretory pathway component GspD/PulD (secretin)